MPLSRNRARKPEISSLRCDHFTGVVRSSRVLVGGICAIPAACGSNDRSSRQGIATLNRKSLSGETRGKDTAFESLSGNLSIANGVANNPDLKVRIQGLSVNGDGSLDLRTLGMDYRIGIIIEGDKSEMADPACQINKRYVGLEWPLRCRGPLELGAKACRVDKEGLSKIGARLATEKLGEKIEEKLGDKVSPELKDALKGLFNR